MHHKDGGGEKIIQGKITITHGVHAVIRYRIKAQFLCHHLTVKIKGCPRQGCAAKGKDIDPFKAFLEPLPVPFKHLKVREQVMGQENGLGRLEMRITGQYQIKIFLREFHNNRLHILDQILGPAYGLPYIDPEIKGALVIPASAGMYLLSQPAYLINKGLFNKGMYVLAVIMNEVPPSFYLPLYLGQGIDNHGGLLVRDYPLFGQHTAMGFRALNILGIEPPVKCYGRIKGVNHFINIFPEPSSPNLFSHP